MPPLEKKLFSADNSYATPTYTIQTNNIRKEINQVVHAKRQKVNQLLRRQILAKSVR